MEPGEPATVLIRRAHLLLTARRPEAAAALLTRALSSDPTNAAAHRLLASCFLTMGGRDAEGLSHAKRAVSLQPDDEWAHRLLSALLLRAGNFKGAREAAVEAVRLAPRAALPHAHLAQVHVAQGDIAEARRCAEEAVRLDPDSPTTHVVLGRVALHSGQEVAAEEAFRRALTIDPHNPEALNYLGLALQRRGEPRSAMDLFAAASRADPRRKAPQANAVALSNALPLMVVLGLILLVVVAYFRVTDPSGENVWNSIIFVLLFGPPLLQMLIRRTRYAHIRWFLPLSLRSMFKTYRPKLLAFTTSALGVVTAIVAAMVLGAAGGSLDGVSGMVIVGVVPFATFVGSGHMRSGRTTRSRPQTRARRGVGVALRLLGGLLLVFVGVSLVSATLRGSLRGTPYETAISPIFLVVGGTSLLGGVVLLVGARR